MHSLSLSPSTIAALWMGTEFGAITAESEADGALLRLSVQASDGTQTVLWDGVFDETPQLIKVSPKQALCLLPGYMLFSITRDDMDAYLGTVLTPDEGVVAPALLGAGQDGIIALFRSDKGSKLAKLKLGAEGYSYGRALNGPQVSDFGTPSHLLEDTTGAYVVAVDNLRKGFELWRYAGKAKWDCLIEKGCYRFGFDGAVTATMLQGDTLWIGAGTGPQGTENLLGMPTSSEILTLDLTTGDVALVVGELRTSPFGLIVPMFGPQTPLRHQAGQMIHLGADGEAVRAVMQKPKGGALVLSVLLGDGIALEETLKGEVLDLGIGPDPWDELTALTR